MSSMMMGEIVARLMITKRLQNGLRLRIGVARLRASHAIDRVGEVGADRPCRTGHWSPRSRRPGPEKSHV
jgi:hypothetical protein